MSLADAVLSTDRLNALLWSALGPHWFVHKCCITQVEITQRGASTKIALMSGVVVVRLRAPLSSIASLSPEQTLSLLRRVELVTEKAADVTLSGPLLKELLSRFCATVDERGKIDAEAWLSVMEDAGKAHHEINWVALRTKSFPLFQSLISLAL